MARARKQMSMEWSLQHGRSTPLCAKGMFWYRERPKEDRDQRVWWQAISGYTFTLWTGQESSQSFSSVAEAKQRADSIPEWCSVWPKCADVERQVSIPPQMADRLAALSQVGRERMFTREELREHREIEASFEHLRFDLSIARQAMGRPGNVATFSIFSTIEKNIIKKLNRKHRALLVQNPSATPNCLPWGEPTDASSMVLGRVDRSPAVVPSPPPPGGPVNGELLVTPCPTHLAVEVNLLTGAQSCPHCGSR